MLPVKYVVVVPVTSSRMVLVENTRWINALANKYGWHVRSVKRLALSAAAETADEGRGCRPPKNSSVRRRGKVVDCRENEENKGGSGRDLGSLP